MTAAAMLIKEIETLPEESVAEVLDFTIFLKRRKNLEKPVTRISIENAYGIFKGINTHFEREEEDRI
ncbi:MAG: DUF2281 domain-containing protein [Candidatus Fibromonas sp.]|jgi:hypothetical protein|nr:DUF2281 domain-containing protein [Candidatus Fibromonas sp.]